MFQGSEYIDEIGSVTKPLSILWQNISNNKETLREEREHSLIVAIGFP